MMRARIASADAALAFAAQAQEGGNAPLPPIAGESMQRITPADHDDADLLSTKPAKRPTLAPAVQEPLTPLPWQAPKAPAAAPKPNMFQPAKVPFKRASESYPGAGKEIPSGPHTAVAVPVGDVDAVEVSEPAPPTPPAAGADPVKEDETMPTELTSPIFEGAEDNGGPRKIIIRILNKVTAQAMLFKSRPNDVVKFGKLTVNTVMCRNSAKNSQSDSAALLDIREELPGKEGGVKQLFRGWMYASSPSITALEHPIYDVTMVACEIAADLPKPEEKSDKRQEKSAAYKKKK